MNGEPKKVQTVDPRIHGLNENISSQQQMSEPPTVLAAMLSILPDVSQQPPLVQVTFGATGGLLAGYLFGKTSKFFAALAGGTVLFVQFCDCQGYLKINKKRLSQDLGQAKNQLMAALGDFDAVGEQNSRRHAGFDSIVVKRSNGSELNKLLSQHARLASGFVGGLLLGFGLS